MNREVAVILYEIARYLELQEENPFKIRAYENAARTVEGLEANLADLAAEGRLREVPGIGKAIAEKIEEYRTTGKIAYLENLKSAYPSTLFELLRVPNLGPKKIRRLFDELGIADMAGLERACAEDRLLALRGFGRKTQQKILEGIREAATAAAQHLLGHARPVALDLLAYIRRSNSLERAELAGSIRRWKPIVNDIDIVACTTRPAELAGDFLRMPFAYTLLARGDTKISIRLATNGMQVDLRIVTPSEFAPALHHFTGSREHNVALRGIAKKRGYKINEYGVFQEATDRRVEIGSERDLYAFLEMELVPPEMRENTGEVEAAAQHRLPPLVALPHLRGIFHVHSLWSDGHVSLSDMIAAAHARGVRYVGISEHSKIAAYAHGVDEHRLMQQSSEIDRLQNDYPDMRILKGIEVDILEDGTLDFPDEVLARLDFVIASVHSHFRMEEGEMTRRICRAISNRHVDILGHPSGRLLLSRSAYAVNLEEVLKTAALKGKCVEINANPDRLDLDWTWVKRAKEMGIKLSINPDAHSIPELDHVEFGIGTARRGWAGPEDIINTWEWDRIQRYFDSRARP